MRAEWDEEQLRYRVLHEIYRRAGHDCARTVTGTEIGAALDLRYEDLFRAIYFLSSHEYVQSQEAGPRVCITRSGIEYIETGAGRRRTVRATEANGRRRPFSW
jgi:hypothetical protein